jgi:hypothetical protein
VPFSEPAIYDSFCRRVIIYGCITQVL